MSNPASDKITVNGCTIRLTRSGAGKPLLFLGGAETPFGWQPFMQDLSKGHDVLAPEHPGFGESEAPAWLDNVHDLANFYLDFIDMLGLDKVTLVGSSLGGWIAADLATRNTSRLAGLVLVDAAGLMIPGVKQIDPFIGSDAEVIRKLFHDGAFAERVIAEQLVPEREDTQLRNQVTHAKLVWQPRLHDPHLRKWLHRIDVPTLVVWGAHDRLFPVDYAHEYARLIPAAKLAIIPSAGHLPQLESPAAFAATVRSFTADIRSAA